MRSKTRIHTCRAAGGHRHHRGAHRHSAAALARARAAGNKVKCLSNMRQLALAQAAFAAENKHKVVSAGTGDEAEQGAWLSQLEPHLGKGGARAVRRCPIDSSPYFDEPFTGVTPPRLRFTSYAINNYVSPTHAPDSASRVIHKMSQVRQSSRVIQFVELAEVGSVAIGDHVHVQDWYRHVVPQATLGKIDQQMPVGRHGGQLAAVVGRAQLRVHGRARRIAARCATFTSIPRSISSIRP